MLIYYPVYRHQPFGCRSLLDLIVPLGAGSHKWSLLKCQNSIVLYYFVILYCIIIRWELFSVINKISPWSVDWIIKGNYLNQFFKLQKIYLLRDQVEQKYRNMDNKQSRSKKGKLLLTKIKRSLLCVHVHLFPSDWERALWLPKRIS